MVEEKIEGAFPLKLQTGEVIPVLELPSNKRAAFSTWDLKQQKNIILFFNHGIQCSDCRRKLKSLAEVYAQFQRLETQVLAISFDSVDQLKKQADGDKIPFPLLSDSKSDSTRRFTCVDEQKNAPCPSIFITDRYGELRKQQIAKEADQLLGEIEILSWLALLETECPECSHL